ncbi:MAG TPA: LemA family protein [Paludibacteraceae bacterium]|nr:LemA family protein [Paludibacteraceae bacterium]HQF50846.1 LemA family protein [Paludibacteraceae bacterium]
MNKSLIITLVVLAAAVLFGVKVYNNLVSLDEQVTNAWSDVETQYQRRSDLIPNLVNIVKGYAKHEATTLQSVIEARSKATSINVDASNLTPEKLAEFQKTQNSISGALGRLIAVAENYPDLKANQNFLELQAQLEGTENRINFARQKFNETTKNFNVAVRKFPNNLIAGFGGFNERPYFKADEGTEKAPTVNFE